MEIILWIIVALTAFIVLGHLGWVMIAFIFRLLFNGGAKRAPAPAICPHCRKADLRADGTCRVCGWPNVWKPVTGDASNEFRETADQISKLLEEGLIDANTHDRVLDALRTAHERRTPNVASLAAQSGKQTPERPPVPVIPLAPATTQAEVAAIGPANVVLFPPLPKVLPHAVEIAEVADPAPLVLAPPPIPPSPRRSLAEMFASFMETNNIRWGELLGGLLIVGCSVALVVSFWAGISQRPWLQFSVLTAVTAACFGLGLYTEHRWKLPTTSRGILLIATLLVPLNFLGFAAFSAGHWPGLLTVAEEIAAFALLAFLLWQSSRVIAPAWPELLTIGACALSATLLLLGRVDRSRISGGGLDFLASIPLIIYGAITLLMLARARHWKRIHTHGANAIFLLLGVLTFATALNLGLLVHRSGDYAASFRQLALPLSLCGLPSLASGMLLWRRVAGARLATVRTAGTTVAVIGALILVAGIAIAWPDPGGMLPIALCNFFALTAIALLFAIPAAHWLALPCGIIAWLLGFHLLIGHISRTSTVVEMAEAFFSASSGTALAPLALLLGGAWELLTRRRRTDDASVYARVTLAVGVISIAFLVPASFGFASADMGATWVYGVYAIAAFVLARRTNRHAFVWAGWILSAASIVELFVAHRLTATPWPAAFLTIATLAALVHWITDRYESKTDRLFTFPARSMAVAASGAAMFLAGSLSSATAAHHATIFAWAAAVLMIVATVDELPSLFIAGQITLAAALVLAVISRLDQRPWFAESPNPLFEPWTMQSVGIALAAVCLTWKFIRLSTGRSHRLGRILDSSQIFDQALIAAPFFIVAGLALSATAVAVAIEFSTRAAPTFDITHLRAIGAGSWIILLLVVVAFAVDRRQLLGTIAIDEILIALWIACPLLAARHASNGSGASSLRWLCAAYFLIGSMAFWFKLFATRSNASKSTARITLMCLGAFPIFLLTLWPASITLAGDSFNGPAADSFFASIGASLSYVIPLVIVASVLVGNAVTERSQGYAFAASVVFCFTGSLGYLLALATAHTPIGAAEVVRLLQINALIMAAFAVSWLAARDLLAALRYAPGNIPAALVGQVRIALGLNSIIVIPAAIFLGLAPTWAARFVAPAGNIWGWAALMSAVAAALWSGAIQRDHLNFRALGLAALALSAMAGLSTAAMLPGRGWDAFHALLSANALAAWGLLGFGWWIVRQDRGDAVVVPLATPSPAPPPLPTGGAEPQQAVAVLNYQRPVENSPQQIAFFGGQPAQTEAIRWTLFVGGIVMALAFRALFFDPDAPWWSMAAALCMAMLAVTLACWGRRPAVLYYAGIALNFAAAAWWLYRGLTRSWSFLDFLSTQAIAAAVPGVAWLVLELQVFRQGPPLPRRRLPAFHHVAAIGGACLAMMVIASITAAHIGDQAPSYHSALAGAAVVSTIAIMFACLWDYRARYALAALYILGLGAICSVLDLAHVSSNWLPWALVTGFAGYGVATSFISNRAPMMERRARDLGIPPQFAGAAFWLPPANSIIALLTIPAACSADFNLDPSWRRMLIATAALSQSLSLGLLSTRAKWPGLRLAAIATIPISAVLFGWACLPSGSTAPVQHCAIAFIIFSFSTCVFHLLLPRLLSADDPWRQAARTASGPLLALSVLSLSATLAAEGFQRAHHPTIRLHGYAIAVFITILCGCAFPLLTALRPGDPPQFSRRSRIRFVYVSEALLAIAFAHLHLAEPQLFSGFLQPYWPLVVMAIAFIGVGAGEMFRRQENEILAEPLGQTGILLPLLPVIGLWFLPAASVNYGTSLLVVAAFYGILAGMRRSIAFGALSALAANGAIWNTLSHSQSFGFTQHPQLWMIPAALSMLAGAQLNRDRLTADRLALIRYASLIAVYVSSTADIFLNGVERAPWMPLVLAALSVAGVLLGVMLRVRAFLFLGMSFLLLAIITMIYFASSQFHWTWIWYVAGILLGAAIIAMFALFEKKRDEMLALIEGLKKWE